MISNILNAVQEAEETRTKQGNKTMSVRKIEAEWKMIALSSTNASKTSGYRSTRYLPHRRLVRSLYGNFVIFLFPAIPFITPLYTYSLNIALATICLIYLSFLVSFTLYIYIYISLKTFLMNRLSTFTIV